MLENIAYLSGSCTHYKIHRFGFVVSKFPTTNGTFTSMLNKVHCEFYKNKIYPIVWTDKSTTLWYNLDISQTASFNSWLYPDVCGLFIKTHKNKLVECFNVYGVIKGEQINVLQRNHDRLAVLNLAG